MTIRCCLWYPQPALSSRSAALSRWYSLFLPKLQRKKREGRFRSWQNQRRWKKLIKELALIMFTAVLLENFIFYRFYGCAPFSAFLKSRIPL